MTSSLLPEILLRSLVDLDREVTDALLAELDDADLTHLATIGAQLADLAAPHHRCTTCRRFTPLDDRAVPGRPYAVDKAPPMRCKTCAATSVPNKEGTP